METRPLSKDEQRFTCVALVCVDFLQLPLIDILANKIKPPDLFNKISACSKLVNGKQLTLEQRKLCFLKPPNIPDYTKFDITLLYKLLRNLCSSLTPQQDWGKEPKANDMAIVHDIERLRMFRNRFAHASSSEFTEDKFENNWKDLKSVIQRIQNFTSSIGCKTNYIDRLKKIKTREFGYDDLEKYKLCVKSILRSGIFKLQLCIFFKKYMNKLVFEYDCEQYDYVFICLYDRSTGNFDKRRQGDRSVVWRYGMF